MKKYFLLGNACLLLAGCQTFDKTLDSADRALAVAKTPTAKTLTDIARSDNREAAIREGLKRRAELYERDPQVVVRDLRGLKRDYDNLVAVLTGKVNRNWGRKETKLPTRTSYIKYTQNYKSRAIVDFDAGTITVETVDDKDPKTSLKNAIVSASSAGKSRRSETQGANLSRLPPELTLAYCVRHRNSGGSIRSPHRALSSIARRPVVPDSTM